VKKIEIKKIADEAPKLTNVAGNVSQPSENQTDENHKGGSELSSSTSHVIVEGGFGKIQPKIAGTEQNREDVEGDDDWASQEFVTMAALQNGRLSEKEMKELDVFKNYEPGEPTSRLYIKNLAKKVTEKDLRFIYGRYVNRNDELEKSMFYVQLLTGRMKGQAFITLPSESSAKEALKDTNGYQLQGKAMVVQFARSVKPKEKDDR
jgi:U11/U12 small nuclear ribonucleoprotein SNRNP65